MWLFIGLMVTFLLGYGMQYYFLNHLDIAQMFFSNKGFIILVIAELLIVILLSSRIAKMSSISAKILYLLYSAITGLTFSSIFIMFELSSVIMVFLATAVVFGIFAVIGNSLNIDLSKFGTYLLIALIGCIVVSLINIFIGSSALDLILCIIIIIIFTLYIGYDIKKIKAMEGTIDDENLAIYGAFQLYLDFINIFIRLLELFGKNRD